MKFRSKVDWHVPQRKEKWFMPSLVESAGSMEMGRNLTSFNSFQATHLRFPKVLHLHRFPKKAARGVTLQSAKDQRQSLIAIRVSSSNSWKKWESLRFSEKRLDGEERGTQNLLTQVQIWKKTKTRAGRRSQRVRKSRRIWLRERMRRSCLPVTLSDCPSYLQWV